MVSTGGGKAGSGGVPSREMRRRGEVGDIGDEKLINRLLKLQEI
jgi:hypothetical protein